MHVPGISSGVNKQSYGATFLIASLSAMFSILMAPWDSFFWPSSQKSGALVPPLYYVLLCLCSLQSQTVRGRRTQSQQKSQKPKRHWDKPGMRTEAGKIRYSSTTMARAEIPETQHTRHQSCAWVGPTWVKGMGGGHMIPNCCKRTAPSSCSTSNLCSAKALCLVIILPFFIFYVLLIVPVFTQVLLFFYWEHKISEIVVTLTFQLYIKIRRKFYLKKDFKKCSVKGQIYFLLAFNLVYN